MFAKLKEIIKTQSEWLQKPATNPWAEHEFCDILEEECWYWLADLTKTPIDKITFKFYQNTVSDITIWLFGEDEEGNFDSFDYTPQRILNEFKDGQQYFERENWETGEIERIECIFCPQELAEGLIQLEDLLQQLSPLLDKVYGPILKAEDDDFIVNIEGSG